MFDARQNSMKAVSTAVAVVIVVVIIVVAAGAYAFLATPGATQTTSSSSSAVVTSSASTTSSTPQSSSSTVAPKPQSATVLLDFVPGSQHVIFYEAQKQGYYDKQALTITIQRGVGSADTAAKVASGTVQFGYLDAGTAINAIAAGANFKILGIFTYSQPYAVFYLNSSSISKPKDLEGKTYCTSTASADHVMFPAFASLAGFNASKVQFVAVTPPYYSYLISGKCDITSDFLYGVGNYVSAINQSGLAHVGVKYFLYSDYGVHTYGYVLIANNDVIKNNPDLVERFIVSSYQGMQYTIDNPAQAVQDFLAAVPGNSLPVQQARFNVYLDVAKPLVNSPQYNKADPRSLGVVNATLMDLTAQYTVKYLGANPLPLSAVYTNDFLTCNLQQCI